MRGRDPRRASLAPVAISFPSGLLLEPTRQTTELPSAAGFERLQALGEVRECYVPELVDETLDPDLRAQFLIRVATQRGRVCVMPAVSGAVEQPLVGQTSHHRHIRRISPRGLGLAV